jgi:hypothetical protein
LRSRLPGPRCDAKVRATIRAQSTYFPIRTSADAASWIPKATPRRFENVPRRLCCFRLYNNDGNSNNDNGNTKNRSAKVAKESRGMGIALQGIFDRDINATRSSIGAEISLLRLHQPFRYANAQALNIDKYQTW